MSGIGYMFLIKRPLKASSIQLVLYSADTEQPPEQNATNIPESQMWFQNFRQKSAQEIPKYMTICLFVCWYFLSWVLSSTDLSQVHIWWLLCKLKYVWNANFTAQKIKTIDYTCISKTISFLCYFQNSIEMFYQVKKPKCLNRKILLIVLYVGAILCTWIHCSVT